MAKLFQACVSQALAYEYEDVLATPERWARTRFVLDALLHRAELVNAYYSWRPSSPDPGDEHVSDCAMNARAIAVPPLKASRSRSGVRARPTSSQAVQ